MNEIDEIESILPHKRPMVLLSEALPETAPGIAEAKIDASEKCKFFDPAVGGVPAFAALEYMAQTMAMFVGRERRRKENQPAVGFVLGTRKMEVFVDMFSPKDTYVARAECTYSDGEFASFNCSIRDAHGTLAAQAELTAFQPDAEEKAKEKP